MAKKKDKKRTEQTRAAVMLILNLLISIFVSFLPDWSDKLLNKPATWKFSEQVLLGIAVFGAFTLVEVLWLLSRDLEEKHAVLQITHLDSLADMMLHNIRAHQTNPAKRCTVFLAGRSRLRLPSPIMPSKVQCIC